VAIYELTRESIRSVDEASFGVLGLKEREDLQRLLRERLEVIAPETKLIAEEFGSWEESYRRIDLLGLDRSANLVIIELKRTQDGGHMELQAIRYAAMVSTMTFDQVVEAHAGYLRRQGSDADPRCAILEFLGWTEPNEEEFARTMRIILVSADFSRELTTSVLWLNQRDLDIRCVRLKPYRLDGRMLVDVQQVIPLPEAAEYQVRVREKIRKEQIARETNRDYTRYDVTLEADVYPGQPKRYAIFRVVRHLCERGVSPEEISPLLPRGPGSWRAIEGEVDAETYRALQGTASPTFDPKRWFCADGEVIHAGGRTYALTNQWGADTAPTLRRLVGTFPTYSISYEEAK
jgi:hypothetical protein